MVRNSAFFYYNCRGGGKVGKKAVEQSYASVVVALTLQFGSCHGLASSGQHEPLRSVSNLYSMFCLNIPFIVLQCSAVPTCRHF